MTVIVKLNPLNPEPWAIEVGARTIVGGGLVAFPTETVYGLGANAYDAQAALRIFAAKGRPADNPLIVHIASFEELWAVAHPPEWLLDALQNLWPGPLTVIVPRNPRIPHSVTAGLETVAVRMPAHPVATSLIKTSGVPIAAPSANTSTRPSPTRAIHVVEDLWGKVDVVLDGGETFFGVESTIVQVGDEGVVVLRPGPYTVDDLSKFFPQVMVSSYARGLSSDKPVAPGMKYKHYAPAKPLFMAADREVLIELSRELLARGYSHVVICTRETCTHLDVPSVVLGGRENLYEVAKNLFNALRLIEKRPEPFGLAEPFDEYGIGLAIMNRLKKACGGVVVRKVDEVLANLNAEENKPA